MKKLIIIIIFLSFNLCTYSQITSGYTRKVFVNDLGKITKKEDVKTKIIYDDYINIISIQEKDKPFKKYHILSDDITGSFEKPEELQPNIYGIQYLFWVVDEKIYKENKQYNPKDILLIGYRLFSDLKNTFSYTTDMWIIQDENFNRVFYLNNYFGLY